MLPAPFRGDAEEVNRPTLCGKGRNKGGRRDIKGYINKRLDGCGVAASQPDSQATLSEHNASKPGEGA